MKKRIFWDMFLLSAGVLLSVTALFFGLLYLYCDAGVRTEMLAWLGRRLCWLLPCFLLLSAAAAWLISRRICTPLRNLNWEHPESSRDYPELEPLFHQLEQQSRQIASQLRELEEKHGKQDAMRRDFTANVSHELRTPLTSISGYAEIIRDGIAKGEDVERFAGKIYDESQRLITLVGDIIKLSQLDGKDIAVTMEPIDLYAACQGVLSLLEPAASLRHIRLQLEGEPAVIIGAQQIIEEMVYNICDNAIKYNREGGSVTVRLRRCVDGVELTVSDTGIGIPQEDLGHIFERFYRVNKSHSKEVGGTGLGLSIVKHGAMFHNAALSVESQLGQGTTIRLLF